MAGALNIAKLVTTIVGWRLAPLQSEVARCLIQVRAVTMRANEHEHEHGYGPWIQQVL